MTEKYPLGIAGPDLNQISRDYTNIVATHEHFALAMIANSWRAFQDSLKETEPVLLIVFADLAPSPDALCETLAGLKNAVVIVLLPQNWAQFKGVVEQARAVRKTYVLPAAPKEVLACGYSIIQTDAAHSRSVAPFHPTPSSSSMAAVGTRVIAFVSSQGGVGRSTLAALNWPQGAASAHSCSPSTCPLPHPCASGHALPPARPNTCSAPRAVSRMPCRVRPTGWT